MPCEHVVYPGRAAAVEVPGLSAERNGPADLFCTSGAGAADKSGGLVEVVGSHEHGWYIMRSLRLFCVVCSAVGGWVCPAVAGYPVVDVIDLFPYDNNSCYDVEFWKDVVYVSSESLDWAGYTLNSVDVSDPSNLAHIAQDGAGFKRSGCMRVVDDRLYVGAWFNGVQIFSISNPGYFTFFGKYDADVSYAAYWNVDVRGDRIYATAGAYPNSDYYGLRILENSQAPQLISFLHTSSGTAGGVKVRGSHVFYSEGQEFEVANISDEQNPYILFSRAYPGTGSLAGVYLRGDYAYVAASGGSPALVIFDISDPVAPVEVFRSDTLWAIDLHFVGNRAFMGSWSGLRTVDITNLASPTLLDVMQVDPYTDATTAWELSVTGNGRYLYVGSGELYYDETGNNYYRGKLYALQAFAQDSDSAGPDRWTDFSGGEPSWDTQYEGDALPTASSPAWRVFQGSETWASVSNGVLRVNDTGTGAGDTIKWWRNWDATNTVGATVLVRARCASYDPGAGPVGYINNVCIEDGKYTKLLTILSDRIRVNDIEWDDGGAFDGTQWHTYRITTKGSQFKLYLDEAADPIVECTLVDGTPRSRVMFGTASGPGKQDIYFDYVYCFSNGVYPPPAVQRSVTPTFSVKAAETAENGSISGIDPASAQVHWSTDGGATWDQGGGAVQVTCTGQYGDYNGVITASNIPLSRASGSVNKVRFALRDVAGNWGWSPIYSVSIKSTVPADLDEDHDVDQADFGRLQRCLSGSALPPAGCELADTNEDLMVNNLDVEVFQDCLAGADLPPACD